MERPTKIIVNKQIDKVSITCIDEMSGSSNGMDIPLNGYKALAEHFKSGVMEISSDEIAILHKQRVSPSTLLDTHVILCKPNYLAKDGSTKKAIVNNYKGKGTWLAPKDDLY